MGSTENAYCRLCAVCKPHDKLVDLQIDQQKRNFTVNKLKLLNCQLDFSENFLPKTVCLVCINSLTHAADFVVAVEQAQVVLRDVILTQPIKKDSYNSDCEGAFVCEILEEKCEDNINVRSESINEAHMKIKSDLCNVGGINKKTDRTSKNKALINQTGSTKNGKEEKLSDLDSVPPSQRKSTWEDYTWTCSYCETQFATVTELISHSMKYHKSCTAYCCTDCNVKRLRLDRFLTHVRTHRKYLQLSCYICFKTFPSAHEVNKHRATHITSNYKCVGCNTSLPSNEELQKHSNLFYKNSRSRNIPLQAQKDILQCLICTKEYKTKTSLHTHLLKHTDRKPKYTCEVCGKCFWQKSGLDAHIMLHEDKRPFRCEICKSSFRNKHQLRYHVGVHDGEKPFSCKQCGKCFRLQKQLTSHSIIHTDSLPHICTFCNKRFRLKAYLNVHIRQHTGVRPYTCDTCGRDFTNWANYNKHLRRRHNMDITKRKYTSGDLCPVGKTTGKVNYPEMDKILEWKNKILYKEKPVPRTDEFTIVMEIKSKETNNN
ncbi:unnamed protein product [Arctia plantaginis]|uniref:Uncharacterized protein n=1 Tax=Arctia plantaginis TaxID=874455 RepID=A0A8S0YV30_ARCPL|nr:unnamed protein product [Arctia plantaginis]